MLKELQWQVYIIKWVLIEINIVNIIITALYNVFFQVGRVTNIHMIRLEILEQYHNNIDKTRSSENQKTTTKLQTTE